MLYFSMTPKLSLILACLISSLRQDPEKIFLRLLSSLLNKLRAGKGQQTLPTRGNCLYFFPLGLIWTQGVELLSSTVRVPHGDLDCSWSSHLSAEMNSLVAFILKEVNLVWKA
jgi:hypothetical protein